MFGLSKEQQIMAGAGAAVGAVALTATGLAIRSGRKAKRAMKKISAMQRTVDDLVTKIAEINQNKINEQKLNKLETDVEIIKNKNHDKIVEDVLKEVENSRRYVKRNKENGTNK